MIPGPALTLPKAAQILEPTPPDHPPPSWKPTLHRGTPPVAEQFSLGGAASSSAPAPSSASFCAGVAPESAAPVRAVHLEPDPRADDIGRAPKAVSTAVIQEAKARGFDPSAVPPPPADPPSVPVASSDIPPPPKNRPPSPAEVARISQAVRVSLGEADSSDAVLVVQSPRLGTVVTSSHGSEVTPPAATPVASEVPTESTPITRPIASPRERQSKRPR